MALHMDENAVRANAQKIAGQAARRKSRKIWALAGLGTLAAGGAAFAAVQLFGFGSINQGAATMKNLNVVSPKLTGSLVPGQSVGGQVDVGNENDFPVKVTAIILQDSSLEATGQGCDPATVSPGGTAVANYPGQGGGAGHQINLPQAITLAPGEGKTITVSNVVSQSANASGLCGVKANFAVVASVGNP
jgi:hypothetical protein